MNGWKASKKRKKGRQMNKKTKVLTLALVSLLLWGVTIWGFVMGSYDLANSQSVSYRVFPKAVALTKNQHVAIKVFQLDAKGHEKEVGPYDVVWEENPLVDVRRGLLFGMEEGFGVLKGKIGETQVAVEFLIDVPNEDYKDIPVSLKFNVEHQIELFAGTGDRGAQDGSNLTATFFEPKSVVGNLEGKVFIQDGGALREIFQESVKTIGRTEAGEHIRIDKEGNLYYNQAGKILSEKDRRIVYESKKESRIQDFLVNAHGVYLLEYTVGKNETHLMFASPKDAVVKELATIGGEAMSLTMGENGSLYIAKETAIYKMGANENTFELISGVAAEKGMIDGKESRYYDIQKIFYHQDRIFMIDGKLLRAMVLKNDAVIDVETISGKWDMTNHDGSYELINTYFYKPSDLYVDGEGRVYLPDQNGNLIYRVIPHSIYR
jgi:hypothetical protein